MTAEPLLKHSEKLSMTRHDAKLQQITDTATSLFVQKGYNETTVDEIAKDLKISKGSIYTYIKSKQDIVFQILIHVENTWKAKFDQVEESFAGMTAVDSLKAAIKAYISTVDQRQNEYILLNHIVVSLDNKGRKQLLGSVRQVAGKFEKIISRGLESGEFCNPQKETIGFIVTRLCSDWANNRWFLRRYMDLNSYTDFVSEMAIRMLRPNKVDTLP